MQTKLVEISLLSDAEVNWLNDYHAQVWEKVGVMYYCCFNCLWLLLLFPLISY